MGRTPDPARSPRNGNGDGEGTSMVGGLSQFASDVSTLAELQAKLAALDLKETAGRATVPVGLAVAAAALGLAALPVGLLGLADLLAYALSLSSGTARLIVAAATLGVAGILIFAVKGSLRASMEPLRRSQDELTRNLSWVRTVLLYSGRPAPRRRF